MRSWLARAGLRLVIANELPVERALRSPGSGSAVLILIDAGSRSGIPLLDFIDQRVRSLREHAPYAGVVAMAGTDVSAGLLPPRTWLLREGRAADAAGMVEAVLENRESREDVFGTWPRATPFAARRGRRAARIPHTVPNFNVRHPAMLVPIARVARALGTPAVCEISPQEALVYHPEGGGTRDHRRRVSAVFSRLRADVDLVAEATGCDLRLHLDHCDDPELIIAALGVGFDSIMADGSSRSLAMNVRFTRRAVELARPYGVPVEGEVGSIDPEGRRKTSRTLLEDLRTFVGEAGVDYVGVNAGQVHGSDYGYRRARRAISDIRDLESAHGGDDPRSLYQACADLDAALRAKGVAGHHPDRRCLRRIRERLVEEPGAGPAAVLQDAYASVPVACWNLLARLERRWRQRCLAVATAKATLYRSVTPGGPALREGESAPRLLDLDLLRQAAAAVAGTGARLVLHGGSSIAYDDLRLLPGLDVARVNVGSRPFQAFVRAVAARGPDEVPAGRDDVWDVVRFLGEHAADWRSWLDDPPAFLSAFEHELGRRFFAPLLRQGLAPLTPVAQDENGSGPTH